MRVPFCGWSARAEARDNGINGNQVGKIQIFDNASYVAVQRKVLRQALTKLTQGKLKGRTFKVRHLR